MCLRLACVSPSVCFQSPPCVRTTSRVSVSHVPSHVPSGLLKGLLCAPTGIVSLLVLCLFHACSAPVSVSTCPLTCPLIYKSPPPTYSSHLPTSPPTHTATSNECSHWAHTGVPSTPHPLRVDPAPLRPKKDQRKKQMKKQRKEGRMFNKPILVMATTLSIPSPTHFMCGLRQRNQSPWSCQFTSTKHH